MLIFTASTGRCGTLFASEVFRSLTSIPSYHEPQPWCVDETLEQVNQLSVLGKVAQIEIDEKIEQIRECSYKGWYFESSQMFIKSYIYRVLTSFKDIGILYIERNPIDVGLSYAKKCKNEESGWFLRSNWKGNFLRTEEELPFYPNILWQWLEIKERFNWAKQYCNKYYELDFEKINQPEEWKRIFSRFGVKYKEFSILPKGLKKNYSIDNDEYAKRKFMQRYNAPMKGIEVYNPEYLRRKQYIDNGIKIIAQNSAEVNRCRI